MAANFGDTIIEGGIEPSVKVQNPVEDNSGAILAGGFKQAFSTAGQVVGSIFKQQEADKSVGVLTNYENELLDLADAVDQGSIKTNEAMVRARNIRRQYLANSPGLQTEFDKVWTNFVDTNGLGSVVRTGTVEQQQELALEAEAFKLGYPDVNSYREFQIAGQRAAVLNQQLDNIKARNGIVTETQKAEALTSIVGLANTAFPAAQKQIIDAQKAIEANPSGKAQIVEQLNLTLGSSIAQLDSLGAGNETGYITEPIKSLLTTFNSWANNEVENGVLENDLKNTQYKYESMFANDPVLGPFIAQSKLLNSVGLSDSQVAGELLTPDVIRSLRDATDPNKNLNILNNTDSSERFTQAIIKAAEAGIEDEEAVKEFQQAIAGIVDGAYVNERVNEDGALGYKGTVEVLGNPAIKEVIGDNPIPAKYADKFVQVLQENYETELVPAIQQYWDSAPVIDLVNSSMSTIPVKDLLQPVWNGSAVEFIVRPEHANNASAQSLAAEVNSGSNSIGIPLNNLINAYANVTGVDAKTIYEQDFAPVLFPEANEDGTQPASVPRASDTPADNFTIGDFNPEAPIEYTTQSSSLKNNEIPFEEGGTDVEGVDMNSYLSSIRTSESGGNDNAKNPSSTATGRYQFLKSTWNDLVKRYPNAGLSTDGRLDPQQQETAIRLFTAENARYLTSNGVGITNGTLYAAHFLGARDAVEVLSASDGLVSDHVPARVINANKFLKGMSVASFKKWAKRKGNA